MQDRMKAVLYMQDKKYELAEVDVPIVGFEEIKVKIKYCAFCATDAHVVLHDLYNRPKGFGLGHEISGVIEELGEGLEHFDFQVGDQVTVFPLLRCGICEYCKRGQPQYCIKKNAARFPGYAEYCVVHATQVYKIPQNGDLKHYALVEPMSCAMRGIDLANIKIGQRIAISGVGGIGLILLNMIMLKGGTTVTAIDPVPSKRETAIKMGATYVIDPTTENIEARSAEITNGQGFDIVFEASGVTAAAKPCLKIIGQCGTVVYFAVYPMDYELPLNLFDLYLKEGKIITAYCDPMDIPRAIQLVARMKMDLIIGKVHLLEDIDRAFEDFGKSIYPKILVEC